MGPAGPTGPTGPAANAILPYSSNGTQFLQTQNKGRLLYALAFGAGASQGGQPPIARDLSNAFTPPAPQWTIFSLDVAFCAPRDFVIRGLSITVFNDATEEVTIPATGNGLRFMICVAAPNDGAFFPTSLQINFEPTLSNFAVTKTAFADVPVSLGEQVALVFISNTDILPVDQEFGVMLGIFGGILYD
jgi:hypothetical protein